jgi:hypothetical protein
MLWLCTNAVISKTTFLTLSVIAALVPACQGSVRNPSGLSRIVKKDSRQACPASQSEARAGMTHNVALLVNFLVSVTKQ